MSCQSQRGFGEPVIRRGNFCQWSTWMLRVFSLTVALCEAPVKLWPLKKHKGKKNNVGLLVRHMLSDGRIPRENLAEKCVRVCMCFLSMANNAAQEICQNKGQTSRLLFSVCAAEEGWDTRICRTVTVNAWIGFFCMINVSLDLLRFFLDWRDIATEGRVMSLWTVSCLLTSLTSCMGHFRCKTSEKMYLSYIIYCTEGFRSLKLYGKIWFYLLKIVFII